MIKAVLFDLDGTMLDREESVKKFIAYQYERLNQWVNAIPKDTFINRFIELDCQGYVWKDKVYKQLVDEFQIKEITWEMLLQDYIDNFKHACIPFDHLKSMLEQLKQQSIKLGIITNGYGQFQRNNIKALCIEHYFDVILVSECEGIKKPNPQIFARALEQLQISPNESVYVGDHALHDICGSKQAGMTAIWKSAVRNWDVEADYIIEGLAEIPKIIKKINNNAAVFL
ncbi:HAD family hydrolase [Fictibacillus nanhaiensis]|uniref:HAD family hydrolase n=1 Tax=Fictibacillus nanhaiensis TaxID=742169 RepID=UPI001C95E348|nr:HAD family hydrolase [Fictibacillus nanhaiensis]